MPCWFCLLDALSFPNIWNNLAWSFFLIPMPVSSTEKLNLFVSFLNLAVTFIDPLLVNFRALEIRLMITYLILLSSETTISGMSYPYSTLNCSPLACICS